VVARVAGLASLRRSGSGKVAWRCFAKVVLLSGRSRCPHVASSLRLNSAPTEVNTVWVSYQMCTHLDEYYAQQATNATPRSGRWYYMLE
jgi:hypothetical protein